MSAPSHPKLPGVVVCIFGGASRDGGRWQQRLWALIADCEAEVASGVVSHRALICLTQG